MKKSTKIFLTILLILIIGIFIHPQKVIYVPKITGKVINENGNPISDANVYRIEKEYFKNKEIGSIESEELRTQTVKTDKNGNFKLDEKSRIEWFHTPLDLPFAWCFGNFEIEKDGYITYQTKFGEFEQFHKKNCYACEKIEFKPVITLKSLKENRNTKQN